MNNDETNLFTNISAWITLDNEPHTHIKVWVKFLQIDAQTILVMKEESNLLLIYYIKVAACHVRKDKIKSHLCTTIYINRL